MEDDLKREAVKDLNTLAPYFVGSALDALKEGDEALKAGEVGKAESQFARLKFSLDCLDRLLSIEKKLESSLARHSRGGVRRKDLPWYKS